MKATYRAMQISQPGVLELIEKPIPTLKSGEVLLKVEACGVCGADISDIDNANPSAQRVPGHEVVGRIVALGENVASIWKKGQRVGVGRLGGHCLECSECRQGKFQLCLNQKAVGSSYDGGYAEMVVARHTALVAIPESLSSEEAAPILCAGIATFNALKKCGAQAGDTVAILGIGGLGHMALQYANRMGFRVVAIGRGADIAQDALALGAHVYLDNDIENSALRLSEMGGAKALITTIDSSSTIVPLLEALSPEGSLVLLNPAKEPLSISGGLIVGGQRSILGFITGTPYDNEQALKFSELVGALPKIETLPLEDAAKALERIRSGNVRYRMVLTMS